MANKFNVSFLEASAKEDINVTKAFMTLAELMHKNSSKLIRRNSYSSLSSNSKVTRKDDKKCC